MKNINLKFGNLRSEQNFTLYPYDGGDTLVIQSDKRIAQINLRTGETVLSKQIQGGAYFMHLSNFFGAITVQFPEDMLTKLKEYLWNNPGKKVHGGIIITKDEELYSKP